MYSHKNVKMRLGFDQLFIYQITSWIKIHSSGYVKDEKKTFLTIRQWQAKRAHEF